MDCSSCGTSLPAGSHLNRRYCSKPCRNREDSRRKAQAARTRRLRERPADPVLAPADLGWLAGIIDGEGSISLSHGGMRSPHLRVNITNGSEAILARVFAILASAGVSYYANPERRGTTNIIIGTEGSLRLHRLLRPHLVRQVEQFDAGASFMLRRYADGRLRVRWSDEDRAEWESLRRRYHSKRGVF